MCDFVKKVKERCESGEHYYEQWVKTKDGGTREYVPKQDLNSIDNQICIFCYKQINQT
tara:strand:+ start:288 stop:461 length:174 start_codon:yes stop_codon:yes gene_type:complete